MLYFCMIIVPNSKCKTTLQTETQVPILLLSHFIEGLLTQTTHFKASQSIIQYYLNSLTDIDVNSSINYLLENDLLDDLSKDSHPNSQWLSNITKSLISMLDKHHLVHPKAIYTYLISQPIDLQYSNIQYYGFSNISRSLEMFFEHYNIQPLAMKENIPSESFYQFQTLSSEIKHAMRWLEDHEDAAIVYLNPTYQEGLKRQQSLTKPSSHIPLNILQGKIHPNEIAYLYARNQYPEGLYLLRYLSKQYYQKKDILLDYYSIHYLKQISEDKIPYSEFYTIAKDILSDWKMEIPKCIHSLGSLQYINATMSYHDWTKLCTQSDSFTLPIYSPNEIQGAHFTNLWILGASEDFWIQKNQIPYIPNQYLDTKDYSHLQKLSSDIIYSSLLTNGTSETLTFHKEATVHYPEENMDIKIDYYQDETTARVDSIKASSSLIQDYATCPFKAFSRHRLQLFMKSHKSHDMEKKDYGIIIHSILEKLYQNIQSQKDLEDIDLNQLSSLIQRSLKPYRFIHPDLRKILERRIKNSLIQWIEKDKSREDFTITALEYKTTLAIKEYQLNLRIDRIDHSQSQPILVDYKTGHAHINQSIDDSLINPQMILYALTQNEIPMIAYAKPLTTHAIFQSLNLQDLENYEDSTSLWLEKAYQYLSDYQSGIYPVKPIYDHVCDQCEFHSLCRYAIGDHHAS